MLFERVCGRIEAFDGFTIPSEAATGIVHLTWSDCFRRALRGRVSGGAPFRILLPRGVHLHHGDLLTNGRETLVVNVEPCEVLVVRPADPRDALLLVLGLGNLHLPVELCGDSVFTVPDGPQEELIRELGLTWETQF